MKEALFYKREGNTVYCELCPNFCSIASDEVGACNNRINKDGRLYSLNYAKVSAMNLDPIEKKPLYHFYPGKKILSLGSYGCSLNCQFCQNASISMRKAVQKEDIFPKDCVEAALNKKSFAIAYTYNEPFVWYEHVLETAKIAKEQSLLNVLVTNGYFNQKSWEELSPFVDAVNIDIKGGASFYKKLCKGSIEPVMKIIESAFLKNMHIELTHLVITNENDNIKEFKLILKDIASMSKEIPLHISRYFPNYNLNHSQTDLNIMKEFYNMAKEELNYVYLGNVWGESSDTTCPNCNAVLVKRDGFKVIKNEEFKEEFCPFCTTIIYGKF